MLSIFWAAAVALAVVCGAVNGRLGEVGAAAAEGAESAIKLVIAMAGPLCLWNGVNKLLSSCGATGALTRAMSPVLKKLFPNACRSAETKNAIGANIAANILGLGNAATPLGMRAAALLGKDCTNGRATDELCRLVTVNTASLQLIPITMASLRAGLGAASPFDIMPAVWIASACSLAAGLTVGRICEKIWKKR